MLHHALLAISLILTAVPTQARVPEAPPGWTHDARYSEAGIEFFTSPDKKVRVVLGPTQPPANSSLDEWLAGAVKQLTQGQKILEGEPAESKRSGSERMATHRVTTQTGNDPPLKQIFIAKRMTPTDAIQLVRIEVKSGAKQDAAALAMLMVVTADLPFVEYETRERIIAEANKVTEDANRAADAEEEMKQAALTRTQTDPGKGLNTSDLHGIAHDMGKMKYDAFSGIWKEAGATTWLMLTDGWAYRNPDIPPADFDAGESRDLEPERWVRWKDNAKFSRVSVYEPLENGARVKLSVKRPRVSGTIGLSTVSTSYLNLHEDGRFDIASYSLTSSDFGDGSKTTIVKSTDKDGESSTLSGGAETGTGEVSTQIWQNSKGINPANMGAYYIDGLTIEMRFDDGKVDRKLFAMDGPDDVILGRTRYWD